MVIDPLSVAGIAFAVFDQLLKLGERTGKLISDAHTFTEDASYLKNIFDGELNRNLILKLLLFEESAIYGGKSLMEKLETGIQDQIKISLARLVGILSEAESLLVRRYGPVKDYGSNQDTHDNEKTILEGSTRVNMMDSIRSYTKGHKSPLNIVIWSFKDKKRAEMIIRRFGEVNGQIHETVKLWVLASSRGIDVKAHLERLRKEDFKALNYKDDANLQLSVENENSESHRIDNGPLMKALGKSLRFESGSFAVIDAFEGRTLLVENRSYESFGENTRDVDPMTIQTMDQLSKLLKQPKEQEFLIPRCQGWAYHGDRRQISLFFETPLGSYAFPMSLNRLLTLTKDSGGPTVNQRICLAYGLARSMAQLHMVKWVHQSLRSGNILLLPSEPVNRLDEKDWCSKLNYSKPWLFGFERSRPDSFASLPMIGTSDHESNIYRHPDKQDRSPNRFEKVHDIYSLGVVLLEIGLWQPAVTLEAGGFRTGTPNAVRKQLEKHAARLSRKIGDRYRDIILTCLSGDFGEAVKGDTKEDLNLQLAFRTQVVDVLRRMLEAI